MALLSSRTGFLVIPSRSAMRTDASRSECPDSTDSTKQGSADAP